MTFFLSLAIGLTVGSLIVSTINSISEWPTYARIGKVLAIAAVFAHLNLILALLLMYMDR